MDSTFENRWKHRLNGATKDMGGKAVLWSETCREKNHIPMYLLSLSVSPFIPYITLKMSS